MAADAEILRTEDRGEGLAEREGVREGEVEEEAGRELGKLALDSSTGRAGDGVRRKGSSSSS